MPDRTDRPIVAFREVVSDFLRQKQAYRCADCGQRILRSYQERIIYKVPPEDCNGDCDHLDNLKLVHFDCSRATKVVDTRRQQADELLNDGMSVRQVAMILKVSERTIQRYVRRRRRVRRPK